MFSGLTWTFPIGEMSGFAGQTLLLLMPVILALLAILFAFLVLDGMSSVFIKILTGALGLQAGGQKKDGADDGELD